MNTEQRFKKMLIEYLERYGTVDIDGIRSNYAQDKSLRGFFYNSTYYSLARIMELSKGNQSIENGKEID